VCHLPRYRFRWTGTPATRPTAVVDAAGGTTTVHAIWNGATQVRRWLVLGARRRPIAQAPWNGLDTRIAIADGVDRVQIVALDASGRVLGSSAATPAS
jgi:hypothetical protein